MSSALRGTDRDDSKGLSSLPSRFPSLTALRAGFAIAALTGAVLLVVATFTTVIEITVGTTSKVVGADTSHSGWDRHGPALVLLAVVALGLAGAALRGVRGTAAGLAGVGLAALLVVLVGDLPDLHRAGALGDVYAGAAAGPGAGWYAESAGAVAVLVAGGLLLGRGAGAQAAPARSEPLPGTAPGR